MPYCLLYTAKTFKPLERCTLAQILSVARIRNETSGLTGILLYGRCTVMQYLEGPRTELEKTFGRIKQDQRIYDLRVDVTRSMTQRLFPNWFMAYDHGRGDDLIPDTFDLRSDEALPAADGRFNLVLTMLRNFRDGVALMDSIHPRSVAQATASAPTL